MEQIRIDRKTLGLRAKSLEKRRSQALSPLQYATPDGGSDVDDDLFARIDALLDVDGHDEDDVA